jgi:hypothetical protein
LVHRASVKRLVSLQFLNLGHSLGLLGRVISPSQGRYLTQTQNKHTHKHPCLEWHSNPRSQLPSERREFMPYTTRVPCPATVHFIRKVFGSNIGRDSVYPLYTFAFVLYTKELYTECPRRKGQYTGRSQYRSF